MIKHLSYLFLILLISGCDNLYLHESDLISSKYYRVVSVDYDDSLGYSDVIRTMSINNTQDLNVNPNNTYTVACRETHSTVNVNGTLIISGTLTVTNRIQINGNGRIIMQPNSRIIANRIIVNNIIQGPSSIDYGRIDVQQIQYNGGSQIIGNIDINIPTSGMDIFIQGSSCVDEIGFNPSLPVEFINVKIVNNQLVWTVGTEFNVDYYSIQKCICDQDTDINSQFIEIGQVPAQGLKTYSYQLSH